MTRLGLAEGGVSLFENRINNPDKYPYIKQGKELVTHRMAQSDNIAYPMVQLQPDGTLKDYGDDFEAARKAAIKNNNIKIFKTKDEAIAYANNGYKTKEFNEYYNNERTRLGLQEGGITDNFILKSIKQLAEEKKYNFDYEKAFDEKGNRIEDIYVNKGNTRDDFVRDVYLNAKARGLKYPEIVASQAAAESRYGASKIAQEANNLFGIKLRKGEEGLAKEFMTKEDYGEGQVPEKANFRVFNSIDESIQGYNKFINDKKYSQALQAETPMEYLQGIKDAGYATDQSYVKTVGDVYQQYKNAGIFD
jgi:uncharacterized FlgJ-related protein